jgi:hypothetical protein
MMKNRIKPTHKSYIDPFIFSLVLIPFFWILSLKADEMPLPPSFPEAITVPATLKFRPATYLKLGKTLFRLEKTPLQKAIDILGVGYMERGGEGCDSYYGTCYRIPATRQEQIIWLMSSVEMGCPEQFITEITAELRPNNESNHMGCPELPKKYQLLSIDRGIWLGTTSKELFQRLGKPSGTQEGWFVYYYLGKVKMKNKRPGEAKYLNFDETNLLAIRLDDDRVIGIRAFKVTTY